MKNTLIISGVIACILCMAWLFGLAPVLKNKCRNILREEGVPGDLIEKSEGLESLWIRGTVSPVLRCLTSHSIEEITITSESLKSLGSLNRGVRILRLRGTSLKRLSGIEKFRDLEELYLEKNKKLSTLSDLAHLPKLRVLSIKENADLTKVPWQSLTLESLHIEHTRLPTDAISESKMLGTLKTFYFDGMAGANAFPDLTTYQKLEELTIYGMDWIGLPALPPLASLHLLNNYRLERVDLKRPNREALKRLSIYAKRIKIDDLLPMPEITDLTLIDFYSEDFTPLTEKMPRLERLGLEDMRGRQIGGLQNLKSLKALTLSEADDLDSLALLRELQALEALHIDGCPGLAAPSFATLSQLKGLKTLFLKGTRIKQLDISGLSNLETLLLTENESLTDLNGLKKSSTLRTLQLTFNQKLEYTDLEDFPPLRSLLWSGSSDLGLGLGSTNQITLEFEQDAVGLLGPEQLISLDLTYNPLERLPPMHLFVNLQKLVLDKTGITGLGGLSGLSHLRTVDLGKTERIESLEGLPSGVKELILATKYTKE